MTTLLSLPVELRLHIYSYVVPKTPLEMPLNTYSGLLYSCKAIRDELEPDICKKMAAHVDGIASSIQKGGDSITYTCPSTVTGWLNLTVSRPKQKDMFLLSDPFMNFSLCNFNTLTVTFHGDAKGYEYYRGRPQTYQSAALNLAKYIGRFAEAPGLEPKMQRWALDWRAYPQFLQINIDSGLSVYQASWETDMWIDEQGMVTGVCFVQKPWMTKTQRRMLKRERTGRAVADT
jgi:hypothetical protein